jgi:hypothetical protein
MSRDKVCLITDLPPHFSIIISIFQISTNQNFQIPMQDLPTHCSECDCIQTLKDYEV